LGRFYLLTAPFRKERGFFVNKENYAAGCFTSPSRESCPIKPSKQKKETAMNSNTDANTTTNAELERQKNAFIEKLIEIVRKQEKPLEPDKPKVQDEV